MADHDTAKPETIHDEIEREIAEHGEGNRRTWFSTAWKGLLVVILLGAGAWFAWPRPGLGPIHPEQSTHKQL